MSLWGCCPTIWSGKERQKWRNPEKRVYMRENKGRYSDIWFFKGCASLQSSDYSGFIEYDML